MGMSGVYIWLNCAAFFHLLTESALTHPSGNGFATPSAQHWAAEIPSQWLL